MGMTCADPCKGTPAPRSAVPRDPLTGIVLVRPDGKDVGDVEHSLGSFGVHVIHVLDLPWGLGVPSLGQF